MCKILEDMCKEAAEKAFAEGAKKGAKEGAKKAAKEAAKRMIETGKLSLVEIAGCVPSLSIDELKKLEAEMIQ